MAAGSTLVIPRRMSSTLPHGRDRRHSYLETLNAVTSELDFIRQNQQSPFTTGGSPETPLSATKTISFVFEGNSIPKFGSNPPLHQHYTEPQGNPNHYYSSPPHPQSSPNYNPVSSPTAADYKTITTGVQSLTVNLQQSTNQMRTPPPNSPFSSTLTAPMSPIAAQPMSPRSWNTKVAVTIPERKMELTPMTRLLHTKPIWYLPNRQRAAAAHYLQPHPVGTFVVRQGRQKNLVLTMKHPGTIPYIQNFPLETTPSGKLKWEKSTREFDKIEDLVDYHMLVEEGLPCRLTLPEAIMKARNVRELQSLAVFEDEFWKRGHTATLLRTSASPTDTVTSMQTPPATRQLPNSPQNLPMSPKLQSPYQIPPSVAAANNQRQNNYRSIVGPTSPLLNRTEYVNMLIPSSTKLDIHQKHTTSSTPFQSYSFSDRDLSSAYQGGWSFENQLKGTGGQQKSCLENRESCQGPMSPSERQPMRFSTQSERDSVLRNVGRRFPPPHDAPPPPPPPSVTTTSKASLSTQQFVPLPANMPANTRHSDAYYKPHELTTRYGHNQLFSSQPPATTAPPVPYKTAQNARVLSMYPPYQMPINTQYNQMPIQTQHNMIPTPYEYSDPIGSSTPSSASKDTEEKSREADSGVYLLEPTRVSGPSAMKQDPLTLFDPLLLSESRTAQQAVIQEDKPSLDVKNENLNMNSNSQQSTNPNSNNHGARPVVVTGNLITLFGEETVDPSGESDNSNSDSEEGMIDDSETSGASNEVNVEEINRTGLSEQTSESELTSSQEMSSGSLETSTEIPGSNPDTTKQTDTEMIKKKYKDPRKSSLTNVKKSINKFVKKKKNQLNQKSMKVVSIRKTYKKKIDPAKDISGAIDRLARDPDSSFSALMEGFIQNAREKGQVEKPEVMMRNVRQFMSGMKNFLFNRQVPEVDAVMDKYPDLSMVELDAIVEGALYLYILNPLKDDIYQCFVNELKRNGALAVLDHNIQIAKSRTMVELGIKPNYTPPAVEIISEIRNLLTEMEEAYSPIKKLDYLLKVVTSVYNSVMDTSSGRNEVQSMGADDFLPMFIYVLVQCEAVNIEVEADYMWGLLEPSKLSGEGGYYLTTLSSAICVLKQFEQENQSETKGFLTVMVAMETGEVVEKTLPVLPGMTATDICRIISHKMQIENAEDDYHLYLLTHEEVSLADSCCPMYVKDDIEANESRFVRFGYKHKKQNVDWPPIKEELI